MIIIQEVSKAAQFGVKREHSGLLPQNLVKLGSRKAPINENVLVYSHLQRGRLRP